MTLFLDNVLDPAGYFRDRDTFGTPEHGRVGWGGSGTLTGPFSGSLLLVPTHRCWFLWSPTPGTYSPMLVPPCPLLLVPTLRCWFLRVPTPGTYSPMLVLLEGIPGGFSLRQRDPAYGEGTSSGFSRGRGGPADEQELTPGPEIKSETGTELS